MHLNKKIYIFIIAIITFINFNFAKSFFKDEDDFHKMFSFNNSNSAYSKAKALLIKGEYEEKLRGRIEQINQELEKTENEEEKNELEKRRQKISDILDGDIGDLLASVIAGKYGKNTMMDPVGNNKMAGIKKGATLLAVGTARDSVGTVFEEWLKKFFIYFFSNVGKPLVSIKRSLFNKGRQPFSVEELNSWQELVCTELKDLEYMVKNAEKITSIGKEEIFRELEFEEVNESKGLKINTDKKSNFLNLWLDFTKSIVPTFEQLAQEIDCRKDYYKQKKTGFGIINVATLLKDKLLIIRNWITKVQSVKDFAALSEIKLIIPAMNKSIENYFNNLKKQIEPGQSINKNKSHLRPNRDRWSDHHNRDDFPSYII